MKNRNHYFKVKPGDDARAFSDIDIETEGFIARLRRTAHDREPYGFLVDAQRRPYDAKKIADIVHLTNQRTGIVLAEAVSARLIDSVARYRSDLADAASRNKRAKARLEAFDSMCMELAGEVIPSTVMLMPTLVDDYLDTEAGKRFGKDGGNPKLVQFPQGVDPLTPPHNEDSLTGDDKTQKSDVRSHSHRSKTESESGERERKAATTARAEGEIGEPFVRWLRMQVREIRSKASLMAMAASDPDAYCSEVRTLTGYSPDEIAQLTGDDGILALRSNEASA